MTGTVVGDVIVYHLVRTSERKKRPPPAPACISKHLPTAYGGWCFFCHSPFYKSKENQPESWSKYLSLWALLDFCFFQVLNAGFSAPTPIQAQSWPIALQSRDIVAVAKTGSGKTLGYLIPGFIHLKRCCKDPRLGPTVLVLSPTRELATQIQVEAVKFGKSSRFSCTVCWSWFHMHVLYKSLFTCMCIFLSKFICYSIY